MKEYDVFLSHAAKDKSSYVDKLAEAIKREGLSLFYDTDCIGWGDNFAEAIEDGLANCYLAVVVISKNYFGRQWTEHELRTLLMRQNKERRKLIMPILHGITKKQLIEHYPELCNIQFKYSKSSTVDDLAKSLQNEVSKRKEL